jgi:hypothetical protein
MIFSVMLVAFYFCDQQVQWTSRRDIINAEIMNDAEYFAINFKTEKESL